MLTYGQHPEADPINPPAANVGHIWKTFFILVGVTAVEFAFAFGIPHEYKSIKIFIFILLTIVKAYFIVSEFMHLGHEKKSLVYSVVGPFVLVLWLVIACLTDAVHYFVSYFDYLINF